MSEKIVTYNNLKEFKAKYDQQMGITRGTLSAGSTSIALTDSRIRSNSAINIYTSRYGVNPSAISVSGTTVTLTFKAQSSNIEVGISVIN